MGMGGEPCIQSEGQSAVDKRIDVSVLCPIHLSLIPDQSRYPSRWKKPGRMVKREKYDYIHRIFTE